MSLVTVKTALGDKLNDFVSGEAILVKQVGSKEEAEAIVSGEGFDLKNNTRLLLKQINDLEELIDIENDLFFLLSKEFWTKAKDSKILWNNTLE